MADFAARLREIIAAFETDECDFPALAVELFKFQFAANPFYRRVCETAGVVPRRLAGWQRIPSVPTTAFKEFEVSCLPVESRTRVFHSSGTTTRRPSRHFHSGESLALYEASLWAWFGRKVLPDLDALTPALKLAALTPPPEQSPHSSLVHMFETVRCRCGASGPVFLGVANADGEWDLNLCEILGLLRAGTAAGQPLVLLGTAFSFVHLLDHLQEQNLRFVLPPGSRVMETGGYKGRARSLPGSALRALITRRLGIPGSHILCEYGMSELSSQAYDASPGTTPDLQADARILRFPPWARVQIISPETGREVADGETGLIRVFDLANVWSVMAIQTEDLGVRRGDGFELLGRAERSEPRGCSLMQV